LRQYAIVDVFTDVPLEGNAVAVFLEGSGLSCAQMQRAARELNLSETVFLLPPEGDADMRTRIFTPTTELPFAGHPVLGTAFLIGEQRKASLVRLETGAGLIRVQLAREGEEIVFGEMEQPIPAAERFERAGELLSILGVRRSGLPVEGYRNGPFHVYVELDSLDAVAALEPNVVELVSLGSIGVNCFAGADGRFKTRMFAPGLGVPEDPATGSAAGPLAVHLARHGRIDYGQQIEIRQGAEIGRPALLYARVEGNARAIERVLVGGAAVIVARGKFRLA
jgi:trans-2,3-dihydro-3-hydroxyanthranilate isomerase